MFAQIRRLGADSLLYAFMNVGTKLIAFIMLPIYTSFLPDPAQYGVLDYLDRFTSMLTFVVIFGTDSALAYYYFDSEDKKKRLEYVRSVMTFRLLIVFIIAIVFLIGGQWLTQLLIDDAKLYYLLYLSIGVMALDTVIALILTVLRYDFFTKKVVTFTILKMLLIAVLSYVFLAYVSPTIDGIIYGRLISVGIVILLLIKPVLKFTRFTFNKNLLKEILIYAAPLVPASLAFWVIVNANSFLLKAFTSLHEVGIYGTAVRFASLITLLTSGVQMAWRPFSMSLKDKKDSPVLFAKLYYGILLIGTLGVLFVATLMPWIIRMLGSGYHEAYQYVAILSAVTFLNFFYMIISVGIFFTKQTKIISYAFGMAAVVNIVLNLMLIPSFSIWGSVSAYLISYLIAITYIFVKSQKLYHVPVSFGKMAFLFLSSLLATAAIVYIQETDISNSNIVFAWLGYFVMILISRLDKDLLRKRSKAL
ncbi:oligosaccharide flippase family protein [Bacillus sp. S/N-304-OC-R1]|uniref:oligosaccharide flippase family protein n=1 Tax=Bacillus sp. S/N-304-OC-R1 TaxID=2758034 RepID=UPI001C8E71AF|nr:oligosaccharide flippase family protein [Bacillus sp. S/N-304-OC-R1]MBY0123496.1 oligosaccharide flippase family protein [Bacillus sp. S/N-304-OC-R1]